MKINVMHPALQLLRPKMDEWLQGEI